MFYEMVYSRTIGSLFYRCCLVVSPSESLVGCWARGELIAIPATCLVSHAGQRDEPV